MELRRSYSIPTSALLQYGVIARVLFPVVNKVSYFANHSVLTLAQAAWRLTHYEDVLSK